MKKDTAQKLTEVIKKIVQKEVNAAVQDIGKVMGKIIKEQVAKELEKHKTILNEYDTVGRAKNNIRDDFNKKINYGYTLTQAANAGNINITNYAPRPQQQMPYQYEEEPQSIKTGNKILDSVFQDVAREMPDDFGRDYSMGMPMTPTMNPLNELNLNMNTMASYGNRMPPQPTPLSQVGQQPINFELPIQDVEGGMLHLDNVPSSVINKLVKNYKPVVNKLESMKPSAGHGLKYNDVGTVNVAGALNVEG